MIVFLYLISKSGFDSQNYEMNVSSQICSRAINNFFSVKRCLQFFSSQRCLFFFLRATQVGRLSFLATLKDSETSGITCCYFAFAAIAPRTRTDEVSPGYIVPDSETSGITCCYFAFAAIEPRTRTDELSPGYIVPCLTEVSGDELEHPHTSYVQLLRCCQ
jgi:hypothetical protein